MAHGGSQLDYHVLQDLKQRFPEIPEAVVSQYLLQVHTHTHPLRTSRVDIFVERFAHLRSIISSEECI